MALSAALRAPGLAATAFATLPPEHERGIGGWQAEVPALADVFLLSHGAVEAVLPTIGNLEVDAVSMRHNLHRGSAGYEVGEAAIVVQAMLAARASA